MQEKMSENYVKTARRRRKFLEIAFLDVTKEQILHINNKDDVSPPLMTQNGSHPLRFSVRSNNGGLTMIKHLKPQGLGPGILQLMKHL